MEKVIVGLSGGVDSAVSAMLLKQRGFEVEALFMKNWDEDDGSEYCTAQADLESALRVTDQLDIELHIANFAPQYWDNVFAGFLREYQAGRTPNPDVLCNREIKFNVFADYARNLGADGIATGHYARVSHDEGVTRLFKGLDSGKDQSYFLNAVTSTQLEGVQFPLGDLEKETVRDMARDAGLVNAERKDSTGICFIGERRFSDFLSRYLPAQPGPIMSIDGEELGSHDGLMYHTLGQRQGLGIGGRRDAGNAPWYVIAKSLDNNTLWVAQGNDHELLHCTRLVATDLNWIGPTPSLPIDCKAKVRYRQADQGCRIERTNDDRLSVVFEEPQRAVTPGQYVVFYRDDQCLGGGVIESTNGIDAATLPPAANA